MDWLLFSVLTVFVNVVSLWCTFMLFCDGFALDVSQVMTEINSTMERATQKEGREASSL